MCVNGREIKREHNCCCFYGQAMANTYFRVNEQHLECLFYCLVLSHYFSYGAGILGIPKQNPEHIAFKIKYFISHCIVYLYDYVVCTNIL